mmetsp:Transcript_19216/g.28168  ORF Transcript_19216/g.28168 Transcript_19216/m.28168 type:complete len:198 (-) Transcript_19216:87-680(-)
MSLLHQQSRTGKLDLPVTLRLHEWTDDNIENNVDGADDNLNPLQNKNPPNLRLKYSPKLVIPYGSTLGRSLLWVIFCWETFIKAFCIWFLIASIPCSIIIHDYNTRNSIITRANLIQSRSGRKRSQVFRAGKRRMRLHKAETLGEGLEVGLGEDRNHHLIMNLQCCLDGADDEIDCDMAISKIQLKIPMQRTCSVLN